MIEDFLQIFTYWPRSLAQSFDDLLHLAIPGNVEFEAMKILYAEKTSLPKIVEYTEFDFIPYLARMSVDLLQPQYGQYVKTYDSYVRNLELNPGEVTVVTKYDVRLFSSVINRFVMIVSFRKPGLENMKISFQAQVYGKSADFKPVHSLILLQENGVKIPYDISKLKEFNTYLEAYQKNISQISATVNNSEAAARDELTKYSRELQAQIDVEARNLENLEINLKNQAQAEAFAVSRDIANLIVSAQGAALQLAERLP